MNTINWSNLTNTYGSVGTAFKNQLQNDVTEIESGSFTSAEAGFGDIQNILNESQFTTLTGNLDADAADLKIKIAAQSYMKNVSLEIAEPHAPAGNYIGLYSGTATEDGDIIEQGITGAADLWDTISNPGANMMNGAGEAYYDDRLVDPASSLGTDWSSSSTLSCIVEKDIRFHNYDGYAVYQGNASNWAPYIHDDTSKADPSSLTNLFQ